MEKPQGRTAGPALRLKIAQEPFERLLVGVVIFPRAEVADVARAPAGCGGTCRGASRSALPAIVRKCGRGRFSNRPYETCWVATSPLEQLLRCRRFVPNRRHEVWQARQGRKNMAHGESRGKRCGPISIASPARGDRSTQLVDYFCRPCRGWCILLRMFPWLTPWATFYRRYAAWILLRALISIGFQSDN
jgi:hypothetical protein